MASNVIAGYVNRPFYALESEPKGFPNASYSPAVFAADRKGHIGTLASRALIAHNKFMAARTRKKPVGKIDYSELTEDKLIYRRKA